VGFDFLSCLVQCMESAAISFHYVYPSKTCETLVFASRMWQVDAQFQNAQFLSQEDSVVTSTGEVWLQCVGTYIAASAMM
jgi:hypothetical protein